ncbi:hypothetical protein Rsub_10470 [Raphidocelis subcapitata]|uniref:Uncharacterized protein n=1 Tax=Raphidocelis subcapitata TaxID=307507 RepID=A0A2V0PMU1_9CHLO|nr:hypothetical protein Rsub_10470 [Raphidocelis subcapitata]|eukprot:GBF98405.1 hypothetical protein Rsub_10470 [Raphidocelis subcapitata]
MYSHLNLSAWSRSVWGAGYERALPSSATRLIRSRSLQTIGELRRQLAGERRRADLEPSLPIEANLARRNAAEQQARVAVLHQSLRRADEDALLTVRVLSASATGPLLLASINGRGSRWAWSTDAVGRLTGRRGFGRRGRWVYDRSLGGKKVWVPAEEDDHPGDGQLPAGMSDSDFDALTTVAASKAAVGGGGAAAAAAQYEPPAWWERPGVLPVSGEAERTRRRSEAERILRRIEQSKNRGEDYALSDILALRAACMAAGGASLETRTVGGRDAIYRAAVDAAVRACLEPGAVDLGDYSPVKLAAGVASDVGLPERRAVDALRGAVAGACRGRVVEAIASLDKGDDMGALTALGQLSSLLTRMPVLDESTPEVGLVAGELNSWAPVAVREKILLLMAQIDEGSAELTARLLDFRPDDALPRVRAALDARGGGGGGGA